MRGLVGCSIVVVAIVLIASSPVVGVVLSLFVFAVVVVLDGRGVRLACLCVVRSAEEWSMKRSSRTCHWLVAARASQSGVC